jgi:leucyl aminopeptidase
MKITVETASASDVRTAMLVIPVPKLAGARWRPPSRIAAVDRALGGQIAAVIASGDFRGQAGEQLLLYPAAESPAERVQLIGLGEEGSLSGESLRGLAGRALDAARDRRAADLAICAPRVRGLRLPEVAQALAEGLVLADYRFDTYRERDEDAPPPLKRAALLIDRAGELKAAREACRTGVVLAESQNVCRQLSNEPANALPPAELANAAKRVAREVGLRAQVMNVAELKRQKMGGILAVGGGSANTPRLIVLDHHPQSSRAKKGAKRPAGSARLPTVCLVGKGITFDSGGVSIKPSAAMDEMKHDMSGAAAVIGALRACALLKLPIRVVGVIAAAENMPSSTAYRPGDVVTTMSKKTVEVLNTDAEGRVVLADALHYAKTKFKPEAIVDLATLTGACVIALGKWASGLFGNHEGLVEAVRAAGETTAERAWPMPLWEEHREAVKSKVADVKNTGAGRNAGASTAAAFLADFAGDTPWVHLDIAGTGWTTTPGPYQPFGATGVGVRLLLELVAHWGDARL